MTTTIALALVLALASTGLINVAYLREHAAASALPPLSLRHPVASLALLLGDRRWVAGFVLESGGFALYVAALALAPLALVQSVGAGGIGLLAFGSARIARRSLSTREARGAVASVAGLLCLALSLVGAGTSSASGSSVAILAWLAATAALAALAVAWGARTGAGVAYGIAGGLLFSIGDIATKIATQGGARTAFAAVLIAAYVLGTALIQMGYQRGAPLTVVGVATLLTNALPIAAGSVLLDEPLPAGVRGVLRVFAFVAVLSGAILLARPDERASSAVAAAHGAERPQPSQ